MRLPGSAADRLGGAGCNSQPKVISGGPQWWWRARSAGKVAAGDTQRPAWRESGRQLGSWVDGMDAVRKGAQSRQCAAELVFPGPALGKMQGEEPGLAGEPSGQGEEAPPQGLGGHRLLPQTYAGCPTGQVVRHHLDGQPGGVGGEAAGRHLFSPTPYLRSRIAFAISAWRRWSASSSSISLFR